MRRRIITATVAGVFGSLAVASLALARDRDGMYRDDDRHWIGMIVMFAIAAAAVAALIMTFRNKGANATPPQPTAAAASTTAGAESLLAERLARGEISPDDYRATLAALRGGAPDAQ